MKIIHRTNVGTSARTMRSQKQEGAAMLVVMGILLAASATAMFAVHSTSFEMRAAGYQRNALQTQYVAESALNSSIAMIDAMGPAALLYAMRQSTPPALQPYEPDLLPGRNGYRITRADFPTDAPPIEADGRWTQQGIQPEFAVDINDEYVFTGAIEGQRSDGYGQLQYLAATFTARGRTRMASDVRLSGDGRDYHEGASDARAFIVSGPFAR